MGEGRAVTLSLGFLSYSLAAAGFLLLTLLLLTSWEGRALGVRLVVACGVTTLVPCSDLGCAAKLASKAGPLIAVVLFAETWRVNSPSSGMQTL